MFFRNKAAFSIPHTQANEDMHGLALRAMIVAKKCGALNYAFPHAIGLGV